MKQEGLVDILCDNKSCIAVEKNLVMHDRTKHIDVKDHFIMELVSK